MPIDKRVVDIRDVAGSIGISPRELLRRMVINNMTRKEMINAAKMAGGILDKKAQRSHIAEWLLYYFDTIPISEEGDFIQIIERAIGRRVLIKNGDE